MSWNLPIGNTPLENKRIYLSGPIQHGNETENWRTEPIDRLKKDFKLDVFDPYQDPKQQWAIDLRKAQQNKNYKEMRKIAKKFVRKDLATVDHAHFIIAYVPYKIPTFGVTHEIICSNNNKKPTLIICPEGKELIPLWFYGFVKPKYMFGSWEDLYLYLSEVDQGKHKKDDRWSIVYGLI